MQETLNRVNELPVPTWNRLGVNSAVFPLMEAGGKRQALPPEFAEIKTGMGHEAADFAAGHCTDYHLIEVPEGAGQQLIALPYEFKHNKSVADVTLIHAKPGSRVTILQSYVSGDDTPAFHTGLTKILVDEGAEVKLVQVQLLSDQSRHYSDVGVKLGDRAKVELVQTELGGGAAFTGAFALLAGYQSSFISDTIYFGDEKRRIDLNYVARHTGKKTVSQMNAAGALLGESDKVYRGTIDFRNGARRAVGHEAENTLLFSPGARNRTVPLILCDEEDVEGQHAATIGKINAAVLFYLQSRGLTEAQAKQLEIEAQFNPTIAKIPDEGLQSKINDYLGRRMQLD